MDIEPNTVFKKRIADRKKRVGFFNLITTKMTRNNLKSYLMIGFLLIIIRQSYSQQIIPLYHEKIPNSKAVKNEEYENEGHFIFKISRPTLTIFLPPAGTANGTGIIVCPGGGYTGVNYVIEGTLIAEKLNKLGIAAFVLKYRLPDDNIMPDKTIGHFRMPSRL